MMKLLNLTHGFLLIAVAAATTLPSAATAATLNVSFTKLTGLTGGSPAGTAVYRADLSNLGFDLNSISIKDNSAGLGGSPGQFSGFDLDAIKLSSVFTDDVTTISAIAGFNVFNFNPTGTVFTAGTQRPPTDPALFGTSGGSIDPTIATLSSFDANSTTGSTAFGFASLGDTGSVGFNLTSSIASASSLYLYIGEVGDNGEVASGTIAVSDEPITTVPEPAFITGLIALGLGMLRQRKANHTQA